jgi:hypothetical protein
MELNKVITTTGTGICSCLTVRLHDTCAFYDTHKRYPDEIDSSHQFGLYTEYPGQRIDKMIMNDYIFDANLPNVNFNHGWQYGWYDQVYLDVLSKMANAICPVSSLVGDKSWEYIQQIGSRTAVLYRGNDKVKEIKATPYKSMIEMAINTGSTSFVVQTDEIEFYNTFKSIFPDTIRFNDIPQIHKNNNAYVLPKENKANFVINFIAALRAIGQAEKLITITGNTGLWVMLFRGHCRETWQFHGQHQNWRKLNT